jgi:hypothetical protein
LILGSLSFCIACSTFSTPFSRLFTLSMVPCSVGMKGIGAENENTGGVGGGGGGRGAAPGRGGSGGGIGAVSGRGEGGGGGGWEAIRGQEEDEEQEKWKV